MGYYTKYFSTILKGARWMRFKQRWEAKSIVNNLRDADNILFKKLSREVETDHKVTQALKDEKKALKELKKSADEVFALIYNAELQEENLLRAIMDIRKALMEMGHNSDKATVNVLQGIIQAMKKDEKLNREGYQDVLAIINGAEKGDSSLRQSIRTWMQKMDAQSLLAKLAAQSEAKKISDSIKNLNATARSLRSIKGRPKSIAANEQQLLFRAKRYIEDGFYELFLLKKRALIWMMKIIYDLTALRDMGYKYARMHYMPTKPQQEQVAKINGILATVLKDFRTIAQGYRIVISHLQNAEKDMAQTAQQLKRAA